MKPWHRQAWHCPICHNDDTGSGKCCYRCENNWDNTPAANSAYIRALLDLRDPAFKAQIDSMFDMMEAS